MPVDFDENFAFIAGYTSGGIAFGITHEQMIAILNEELMEEYLESEEKYLINLVQEFSKK